MDFGDIIFFIVFVVIIVSNIMKAMKKAGKQTSGNEKDGAQPVKKTGWKNVLEQMLEEARKQMENQGEPESAGSPQKHPTGKHPTGWEDITTEKSPERAKEIRPSRQPVIHTDLITKKAKFRPECMRCNEFMKEITDMGTGRQSGLIYCDSCGEQHKYQILNGELQLKQVDAVREKLVRAPERSYQEVEEKRRAQGKMSAVEHDETASLSGTINIPRKMTREDLRNAVVWSEILGKPLGLRDLET